MPENQLQLGNQATK